MNAIISTSLLLVCLCLVQAAKDECKISGKGKVSTFAGTKVMIKMPCKYQATTFKCQGYKVHVSPGQAFDSKARYFTDTLWLSVVKMDSRFYWSGRTSTKRVSKYFNDTDGTREPFRTKEQELDGAPFNMVFSGDADQYSVSMGVSDSDFKVTFHGYDESDQLRMRRAGVTVTCPEAEFPESGQYPFSLCGNDTDTRAIRNRKSELKTGTKTKTVLFDILNNALPAQTNPQCDSIFRIFDTCPNRVECIKSCYPVIANNKIMKCLNKYYFDPMDAFIHCMKYLCEGNSDSCDMLQDAMDGCPKNPSLPLGPCPKTGIENQS